MTLIRFFHVKNQMNEFLFLFVRTKTCQSSFLMISLLMYVSIRCCYDPFHWHKLFCMMSYFCLFFFSSFDNFRFFFLHLKSFRLQCTNAQITINKTKQLTYKWEKTLREHIRFYRDTSQSVGCWHITLHVNVNCLRACNCQR